MSDKTKGQPHNPNPFFSNYNGPVISLFDSAGELPDDVRIKKQEEREEKILVVPSKIKIDI